MLDQLSQEFVNSNFKVYDHNWRFYKDFLGEPFLVEDVLTYFDGEILYICAFSLENIQLKTSVEKVLAKLNTFIDTDKIKVIDIWGNIDTNSHFFEPEKILDYTPSNDCMFDCILDVEAFSFDKRKKARLAFNAARNQGLVCSVCKRKTLSYRHLLLMKKFIADHNLSSTGKHIFLSIEDAIKEENSYLVEAYNKDNQLVGFSLLMVPSKSDAVYVLACFDNTTRASDIVINECINFCKKNTISYLHLGYSASQSLLNFKIKWGGIAKGQLYEEYFLDIHTDEYLADHIMKGTFLWRNRLS